MILSEIYLSLGIYLEKELFNFEEYSIALNRQ